jgi:hypothetical protein
MPLCLDRKTSFILAIIALLTDGELLPEEGMAGPKACVRVYPAGGM